MKKLLTVILEVVNSKRENIKQQKDEKKNSQTVAKIQEDVTLKI